MYKLNQSQRIKITSNKKIKKLLLIFTKIKKNLISVD